jgi:serine phosphatase RsbU (regulator of sigma subunit)
MDAVLLRINYESDKLSYAAANNSFYIVRNKQLIALKADKMPVGKYADEIVKPFTTGEFKLEKGDMVYALTDGYPDQFGGPKGKKFKYKQLEDLLIEVSDEKSTAQKKILSQKFADWKGDHEQVDDVLIIGIRF